MKIFKLLTLALVVCLCLSTLISCSKDEKTEGTNSSAAESSSPVSESNDAESAEASTEESEPSEWIGNDESVVSDVESTDTSDSTEDVPVESESEDSPVNADLPVPTLAVKDNGDGTVTASLKLPAGVANGEIIVTTSDKLNYVSGSANSDIGIINDAGAFNGVFVTFAAIDFYDEGTTAISINYRIAEGAVISEEDFWCDDWQIGDGTKWLSKKGQGGCKELIVFE